MKTLIFALYCAVFFGTLIWSSEGLEEITYGIMFDAGSGSTKAYLYQWNRNETVSLYRQNSFKAVIDNATGNPVAYNSKNISQSLHHYRS